MAVRENTGGSNDWDEELVYSVRAWRWPVAATPNDDAASAHVLVCPVAGWSQRNERSFMMNQTDGWMGGMGGWMGGGMWIWTVIGVLVVVLLVVVINKLSNK
jgi:hypothetical protein